MKRRWSLLWAARFIAPWEGYLPFAVGDSLAGGLATQGYGHTHFAGPPIPVVGGPRWSKAKALRVLAHDCRGASHEVDRLIHNRLTVRRRIALISLVFNCGASVLSGTELQRALNQGRWQRAAELILQYDHAGGVEVLGLKRRRMSEAWLLLHPRRIRHEIKPRKRDRVHARGEQRPH